VFVELDELEDDVVDDEVPFFARILLYYSAIDSVY
jgi:hypothetical protein